MNKLISKRIFTSFILLFILILMVTFDLFSTYILIVFSVLSVIEFLNITNKIFFKSFIKFLINLIFIFYLLIFCILFFYFSNFIQLKIILYFLIFTCAASDIGGFVFGKFLKGPKLTKISPNKTYAGAIGSLISSSLVIYFFIIYLKINFSFLFLIIGIGTSIACQIGDLLFSYLKRKARIKDTGNILPGHGGILDRLDGILLGLPIGLILLKLIA